MNWNQPTLQQAAGWILDRVESSDGEVDLNHMDIVVPGKRAGRGLLGALVDESAKRGVVLVPGLILTPAELPSVLLGIPGRHASPIAQRLAWVSALESVAPEHLRSFIPEPPESGRFEEWIGIGGWISGIAGSLCDAGLRMGDVVECGSDVLDEYESARWTLLGDIQSRYEKSLKELGLVDDRLATLDRVQGVEPGTVGRHLMLIGVSELGSMARRAIELARCRVESLVFAPGDMGDRFDGLGCVVSEEWADSEIDINEDRIVFAQSPGDMCQRALAEIARRGERITTSDCVIGLGDEGLISGLRLKASMVGDRGIEIHSPAAIAATTTPPGLLVGLIKAHLGERSFDSLMGLVRHPDFERALIRMDDSENSGAWWIEHLDVIRQDHVLSSDREIPAGIHRTHAGAVEFVIGSTRVLLNAFEGGSDDGLPINDWARRLGAALELVYQGIEFDPGNEADTGTINGLGAVRVVADEITELNQLGGSIPSASSQGALALVLDRLGEIQNPEPLRIDALESAGWLELLHDPSPVCVVIGMSEACVPGSITHDPLLPGSLRAVLGMPTNEERLSRDTYLMSAINASRDAVFMCARAGEKNDPITPSRLLLRASGTRLADRIRRFVEPGLDTTTKYRLRVPVHHGSVDRFRTSLRIAEGYEKPLSMGVTDFDAFLRSPAQWYLQRSLKLNELDTQSRELSAAGVGSLVHGVLEGFGKDETMRDLDDPAAINEALCDLLDSTTRSMFGATPAAAVQVQVELLRYRLGWFAHHQAQRRREGWSMVQWEWSPSKDNPAVLMVDGEPMGLRGKVDRIDYQESTGRWAVIDYKTGVVQDPRKAHMRKDLWCKLQLPLYRHLVKEIVGEDSIELGYMGLPVNETEKASPRADWGDEELLAADETAFDVVRQIRAFEVGDEVSLGESPPGTGHLGFITGCRFEIGGAERAEESNDEDPGVML